MMQKKGFTLIELMVVIMIVGILAAVSVPMMSGRVDAAKWSEGSATAGSIRVGVRAYVAEHGTTAAIADLEDQTADDILSELGFNAGDLTGTYFSASDFTVKNINTTTGICDVEVDGTAAGLTGTKTLKQNGDFE